MKNLPYHQNFIPKNNFLYWTRPQSKIEKEVRISLHEYTRENDDHQNNYEINNLMDSLLRNRKSQNNEKIKEFFIKRKAELIGLCKQRYFNLSHIYQIIDNVGDDPNYEISEDIQDELNYPKRLLELQNLVRLEQKYREYMQTIQHTQSQLKEHKRSVPEKKTSKSYETIKHKGDTLGAAVIRLTGKNAKQINWKMPVRYESNKITQARYDRWQKSSTPWKLPTGFMENKDKKTFALKTMHLVYVGQCVRIEDGIVVVSDAQSGRPAPTPEKPTLSNSDKELVKQWKQNQFPKISENLPDSVDSQYFKNEHTRLIKDKEKLTRDKKGIIRQLDSNVDKSLIRKMKEYEKNVEAFNKRVVIFNARLKEYKERVEFDKLVNKYLRTRIPTISGGMTKYVDRISKLKDLKAEIDRLRALPDENGIKNIEEIRKLRALIEKYLSEVAKIKQEIKLQQEQRERQNSYPKIWPDGVPIEIDGNLYDLEYLPNQPAWYRVKPGQTKESDGGNAAQKFRGFRRAFISNIGYTKKLRESGKHDLIELLLIEEFRAGGALEDLREKGISMDLLLTLYDICNTQFRTQGLVSRNDVKIRKNPNKSWGQIWKKEYQISLVGINNGKWIGFDDLGELNDELKKYKKRKGKK